MLCNTTDLLNHTRCNFDNSMDKGNSKNLISGDAKSNSDKKVIEQFDTTNNNNNNNKNDNNNNNNNNNTNTSDDNSFDVEVVKSKFEKILRFSENVNDHYEILYDERLGVSAFSQVYKCKSKATSEIYSVKVIDGTQLKYLDVQDEIKVHCICSVHPNVVTLHHVFLSGTVIYMVMDFIEGGELFEKVRTEKFLSENISRKAVLQVLDVIHFMHENGIIYRDVKLENVLCCNDGNVKVIDFGFGRITDVAIKLRLPCYTRYYVAPEVVQMKCYSFSVDMWALGVMIFIMLLGYPPFSSNLQERCHEPIEFDEEACEQLSEPARELIEKLLSIDASARFSASDAFQHTWLKEANYKLFDGISVENVNKMKVVLKQLMRTQNWNIVAGREIA